MDRCPSTDELRRLLDAKGFSPESQAFETHLEKCPACQQALEEMTGGAGQLSPAEGGAMGSRAGGPATVPQAVDFLLRLAQAPPPSPGTETSRPTVPSGHDAADEVELPDVPGYEVLDLLGRGGMAVVYRARQAGLQRVVALKMIAVGVNALTEARERFRIEAEAVARLQHPHIIQVYEVGEHAGRPFLVMELAGGGSLARRLAGTPLPPREGAALVETLARTVHYAHGRGVLHRDLTPGNVLLQTEEDESVGEEKESSLPHSSSFVPKVGDFGLAKFLVGGQSLTQTGAVLGTPSYMAPEQAGGKTKEVGQAADIYALGAILYECLTGRPPFRSATPMETVLQVLRDEPVSPRRFQPATPRDLETICLKCLEKSPARRYPSAEDLAEDLGRWQRGEPIRARPVSTVERTAKWVRRRPVVAGLAAALILAVAGGFSAMTVLWLRAERHRSAAETNLRLARQAVDDYCLKVSGDNRLRDNRPLRRELLQTAVPFYERFLERRSDDPAVRAELGQASLRLADVTREIGDVTQALARSEQAVGFFAPLARDYPEERGHQRGLASSFRLSGDIYRAVGRTADAEGAYRQGLAVLQPVADAQPEDLAVRGEMAAAHLGLAHLQAQVGQTAPAEESYREALRIQRQIAQLRPAEDEHRKDIAATLTGLGVLYMAVGRRDEAEKVYGEALTLRRQLVKDNPGVAHHQYNLAVSLNNLGILNYERGKMAEAEQVYREAAALDRQLADRHPEVLHYQSILGKALDNLANARVRLKKIPEAEQAYQQAQAVFQRLAERHPLVLEYAVDLAGNLANQGNFLRDAQRPKEALSRYEAALASAQGVLAKEPGHSLARLLMSVTYEGKAKALADLGRHEEAVRECEQSLLWDNGKDRAAIRVTRAVLLARAKDHKRAVTEADDLARDPSLTSENRYDLACALSLASAGVSEDMSLAPAERHRLAGQYGTSAVELLRKLHSAGAFKDPAVFADLQKDKNLDALRSRPDFQKVFAQPQRKMPAAP
jgi:tetratricopeptide (TPR) repeat protein